MQRVIPNVAGGEQVDPEPVEGRGSRVLRAKGAQAQAEQVVQVVQTVQEFKRWIPSLSREEVVIEPAEITH